MKENEMKDSTSKVTIPEMYKPDFECIIKDEIKITQNQIEQIISHHGNGTYEENEAKKYLTFLERILTVSEI